jgi:hypothetical protein
MIASLLLATAMAAQAPADTTTYPPCSATVKDACTETRATPKHWVKKKTVKKTTKTVKKTEEKK